MKHFFTLDGKNSTDFQTYIATSNMFDAAEHDDESVVVPGRNGTIIFNNGRYQNFTGTLNAYIPKGMRWNVDALRAFLLTKHQYCRYEDTLHPNEYRMARFTGAFSLSESDRVGAVLDLKFDCKPQRWLKSGETSLTFTGSSIIFNPTLYDARPLLRCYGQSGTVTLNGIAVSVSGCTSYVDLDCELMESYEGSTSRNNTTTLTNGEFPYLSTGQNAISFTGFTSVVVTPRWWQI